MKRIAIIGGGIGGCSAAYFANKQIPNVKITIYDAKDRIGGRILTNKTNGFNLELGAAFFNQANKTILGLAKNSKLKLNRIEENKNFAIWNGSEFIFRSNKKAAINDLKLLTRYKLSVVRTLFLIREAKEKIAKLYQGEHKNPTDITELFNSEGLNKWVRKTFDELLVEKGISRTFIDEAITPITRIIYSQNTDLGGFAGISSLIGTYGEPHYNLTEGNCALPVYLAEASNAAIKLKQKVTSIEKTHEGFYRVSTETEATLFSGVIIAAPLEFADIELDGIIKPKNEPQEYQKVYTKAMKGTFNPKHFGVNDSTEPPAVILTTKDAHQITHYRIQKTEKAQSLITISSTEPLTETDFSGVFKTGPSPVLQHHWTAAYPKFKTITKLPPSRIDERLIYLNAIEAAVSSMETASLSALIATKILKAEIMK